MKHMPEEEFDEGEFNGRLCSVQGDDGIPGVGLVLDDGTGYWHTVVFDCPNAAEITELLGQHVGEDITLTFRGDSLEIEGYGLGRIIGIDPSNN